MKKKTNTVDYYYNPQCYQVWGNNVLPTSFSFIYNKVSSFLFFLWFYSLELFIILAMFFANLPSPFPYKYSINSMCYSFKYFYYQWICFLKLLTFCFFFQAATFVRLLLILYTSFMASLASILNKYSIFYFLVDACIRVLICFFYFVHLS